MGAIRQQKDIEEFLLGQLGHEGAAALFAEQSRLLDELVAGATGKSKD